MKNLDFEKVNTCAKTLLEDIASSKSTKSQLKTKYSEKFSERVIEASLNFLKDQGYIGGKKVDNLDYYSRITGYYQKVSGWNAGKLQEFRNRHRYASI